MAATMATMTAMTAATIAATRIVTAASWRHVAAASRFAAAAAAIATTAVENAQQAERLGLTADTHQTRCQHGSHNTILHGEAPRDLEHRETDTTDTLVARSRRPRGAQGNCGSRNSD
jgi:hypothetical protein